MQARIYRPARNTMQSGRATAKTWVVEFEPAAPRVVEPLMGWVASTDTQAQVRLKFASKEEAIAYAKREGLSYVVYDEGAQRAARPKSYADNFRPDRII